MLITIIILNIIPLRTGTTSTKLITFYMLFINMRNSCAQRCICKLVININFNLRRLGKVSEKRSKKSEKTF